MLVDWVMKHVGKRKLWRNKSPGSGIAAKSHWSQPALTPTRCVTVDKVFNFCVPPLPHLLDGDDNTTYFTEL